MGSLTSKTSSQAFFLRILKVILQLRDAARLAASKNKRKLIESQGPSVPASSTMNATAEGIVATPDSSQPVGTSNRSAGEASEAPAPMEVQLMKFVTYKIFLFIFNCIPG